MGTGQKPHEFREFSVSLRLHDQVKVAGHHAEGEQPNRDSVASLCGASDEGVIVTWAIKQA